jgi:DNA adenine methylase
MGDTSTPWRTVLLVSLTPSSNVPVDLTGLPIIKWVGGKARLLEHILAHFENQSRIVEPFFGGGAVSFALSAQYPQLEVYGNDKIKELIEIYTTVAADPDAFIRVVESYATPYLTHATKDERRAFYYTVRDRYMASQLDGPEVLFFLLWCAYSGMYRTGKAFPGRFNTPHGFGKERADFYHPERLRQAAPAIASWHLSHVDFADLAPFVTADTFVYLDPPYRETYGGYTADGFCEADQLRVIEFAKTADARGATFVYSNKYQDDGFYEKHFAGFEISFVDVRHMVNHNVATVGRPKVSEVLITNHRVTPAPFAPGIAPSARAIAA